MKRTFLFLACLVMSGLVTSAQELRTITPLGPQPMSPFSLWEKLGMRE